jgi:membrane protease YdiL (CAAX protease family)
MIRQDTISHMCIVLALAITLYLFTYEKTTIVLFPSILLLGGLVMELLFERKEEYVDSIGEPATLRQIGMWTGVAVAGMLLSGVAINYVKASAPMQLTGTNAILYSTLIAVSEEQFFRGFWTDWLLVRLPNPVLALFSSAGIFTIYHFARYGTASDALVYVFMGGFILAFVAYKSRRLSPNMLGHILNNVFSFVR